MDPEGTVFFGDEVAAWILGNWGVKLKYSLKEYLELWERVREVKGELGLSATEIEKVGFVFGKRRLEGGGEGGKGDAKGGAKGKFEGSAKRKVDDVEKEEVEKDSQTKAEVESKPAAGKKKTKVEEISPPLTATGTRRSTRSKKNL